MEIPKDKEVIEWPTSTMWVDENGILCAIMKKVPALSLEESQKSMDEFKQVMGDKKFCMLLEITNSTPSSKEVRDHGATELPKIVKAMGLISRSPLSKMVANLFFALKPPPYPTKMFAEEHEAKEWLKQYL